VGGCSLGRIVARRAPKFQARLTKWFCTTACRRVPVSAWSVLA